VTTEKLAIIYEAHPKGVQYRRDELAGWLLNLSRYSNGGTDRPFWLEAYVGGPYQVDRVKNPEPVLISHLACAVFGTIQPERLIDALDGADDGLAGRFLWTWPEPRPFDQPRSACDEAAAAERLSKLADLTMPKDEAGRPYPSYMRLATDAVPILRDFGREMQAAENASTGLLKSAIGKARGQALRLALVLEMLWRTAGDHIQPVEISSAAMLAAADMMDRYFLPTAKRVLADASIPEDERSARTLANWIAVTRPERINVSSVRDEARLPGLRDSGAVKAACRYLVEAHWLIDASHTPTGGRPRGDYLVNPALWDMLP